MTETRWGHGRQNIWIRYVHTKEWYSNSDVVQVQSPYKVLWNNKCNESITREKKRTIVTQCLAH